MKYHEISLEYSGTANCKMWRWHSLMIFNSNEYTYIYIYYMYSYLDLPRGAEWIRGACTPSLRVQTAPFGRCWYIHHISSSTAVHGEFGHRLANTTVPGSEGSDSISSTEGPDGKIGWDQKWRILEVFLLDHPIRLRSADPSGACRLMVLLFIYQIPEIQMAYCTNLGNPDGIWKQRMLFDRLLSIHQESEEMSAPDLKPSMETGHN